MPKFLPVPKAIEIVTGYRPNPSTCWRWAQFGVKGVVLRTWMLGGRRKTTIDAVEQFIAERSKPPRPRSAGDDPIREELFRELGLTDSEAE